MSHAHSHHRLTVTRDWILIVACCGVALLLWQAFPSPAHKLERLVNNKEEHTQLLRLRNVQLTAEIARTEYEQEQGLSGRDNLPAFAGMLFVYKQDVVPEFWMKDMRFPLDILWINKSLEIVGVERDVPPGSYPNTFSPPEPIRYVLEVNGGFTSDYNVNPGDRLAL